MSEPLFSFRLQHVDAKSAHGGRPSQRRTGRLKCPRFMPVGTQGTVKGLEIEMLRATGANGAGEHVSSGAAAG